MAENYKFPHIWGNTQWTEFFDFEASKFGDFGDPTYGYIDVNNVINYPNNVGIYASISPNGGSDMQAVDAPTPLYKITHIWPWASVTRILMYKSDITNIGGTYAFQLFSIGY